MEFYRESMRRIDALPGLTKTAFGMAVPWREQNGLGLRFSGDGHTHVRARRTSTAIIEGAAMKSRSDFSFA